MAQDEIRDKLDRFIRKYYLNQLVRGLLVGSSLILGVFLFLNLFEYYGHFSSMIRAFLFWGFWIVLSATLWFWIVKPIFGLYSLGKIISYQEAANIIGTHFNEVKDKLINLLQLEEMQQSHPESSLLAAGIDQKTKDLKPVQFTNAINLSKNKKYLRYLALPLVLMGVIILFQSSIITEGAERILNYNRHFEIKAPFQFILKNQSLDVDKGSDFKIELKLSGNKLPESVYLNYLSQDIKMNREENGNFSYELKNVTQTADFHFSAAGFTSAEYNIRVTPVPLLTGSKATVHYPAYTGKLSEQFSGTQDFVVPEGSRIDWTFDTRDAENLFLIHNGNTEEFEKVNRSGRFKISKTLFKSNRYSIFMGNSAAKKRDTVSFSVSVVADQFPSVFAEQRLDSADIHQLFFLGNASDDYGITKVTFNYKYIQSEDPGKIRSALRTVPLTLLSRGIDASFYYVLNMNAIGMSPSDEVEYYFEAWDNDGIHGSKSSKTQIKTLRRKSIEESRKEADVTAGNVKKLMQEAFKNAQQLQKQNQKVQDQFNRQKNLNWENKSSVEDLLQKQREFFEKIQEMQAEKEKLRQQKEEFQKDPAFKEKQKQLDELFKQMEDPEIKKLMEEIQKLLEKQAGKDQVKDKLNQLENKTRDFAKDLDKLMEQYKQLQLEQKLNDNIERLEKLAEKEEKLSQKTQNSEKKNQEELLKEQKEINSEFNDILEEIKEAEQLNKELEKPMKLDFGKEESKGAKQEMGNAEKNIEENKNKKASENQKNAAEQMRKAAQKMKESLEDEQDKRLGEDYQKVRELLENLVEASFEQESVFTELSTLREINPKFIELNRRQMSVKEQCAMIEDSLRGLAKRQPMISTFITREISRINQNMEYALGHLKTRQLSEAAVREQFVMTGLNNLAVMLMESMENMQQQLAQKKKQKGNQSCNNPNNSGEGQKNSGKKLSEGQQKLGESLKQLQQKAQQQRQGQGSGGKEGQRELNKEYAKTALMQEALRRQLQELKKSLEKEGPDGKALSKEIQKTEEMMEQQERDLVNKKITPEMLRRQKEIETRMLEHEKSDRNQQQEDKRESNSPGSYTPDLPPELKQYIKTKMQEREMLRTAPPELNPYYREKSREYLRTIK